MAARKPPFPAMPLNARAWQKTAESLGLSSQQTRIVEFILRDYPETAIAEELGLSINTVKTYIKRVYARLEVRSRKPLRATCESSLEK